MVLRDFVKPVPAEFFIALGLSYFCHHSSLPPTPTHLDSGTFTFVCSVAW